MLCPACEEDMLIVEYRGVELDLCVSCSGIWFDADELSLLFAEAGIEEEGARDLEAVLATPKKGAQNSRWRCPRCDRKMHHAEAPGRAVPVTIDRCPKGDGLWFDEHELAEVLGSELAEDHPGLQSVKDFLGSFAEAPQQEKES